MGINHLGNSDGYNPRNSRNINVGDQFSIDHLKSIQRGIDRNEIVSGDGYQVARYSNATVIRVRQNTTGGAFRNFQVLPYTDVNGACHVTCSIGTVNRVIPKIGSLYLDQLDAEELPPKITITADGYIVLEVAYEADKPFPNTTVVKFVNQLETELNASTSQYPLASVKYIPADAAKKEPADVVATQIHATGNLSVARVKVGASTFYWQWWIV